MRSSLRLPVICTVLAFGLTGAWLHLREPALELPPRMSRAAVEALPEASRISLAVTELRLRLTAAGAESGAWRAWPDPARHVLAWSLLEGEGVEGAPRRFPGFAAITSGAGRGLPGLDAAAAAYQALGHGAAAAAVESGDEAGYLRAIGRDGTVAAMRTYLQQHLAEIFPDQ